MKLKQIVTMTQNKKTSQWSLHLKIKILRKMKLEPGDIMEFKLTNDKRMKKKVKKNGN